MATFKDILPETAPSRELTAWLEAEVADAMGALAQPGCDLRHADTLRGEIALAQRIMDKLAPPKADAQESPRGSPY